MAMGLCCDHLLGKKTRLMGTDTTARRIRLHFRLRGRALSLTIHIGSPVALAGYQGFSVGDSPVLLSLLNDEQTRLLGEITDAGTTHQIAAMVGNILQVLFT